MAVSITIEVTVSVSNNFSDDVFDPASECYTNFISKFKDQMGKFYERIIKEQNDKQNYKSINIKKLSKGSIIVDHDVEIEFDVENYKYAYDDTVTFLKHTLKKTNSTNITNDTDDLMFDASKAVVTSGQLPGVCALVISNQFSQYFYFVNNSKEGPLCVTNCSKSNNHYLNCEVGQCSVDEKGPRCFCPFSDDYWYTGLRCEVAISKPGVYGGVAAGLAVLLIIVAVLTMRLYMRRHSRRKETLICAESRWYEDDWEADIRAPGEIFRARTKYNVRDAEEAAFGADMFKLDLGTVDTYVKVTTSRPVTNLKVTKKPDN
uniref:SEA domain-containing protein n=1 Tax=Leptobrachium leishanense TaxID=445787 RepID=A0A8C5PFF1_9ANUR